MIKVTRLDGELFLLNADLIRYVEARPDTFVTLTSGERIMVRESMDEVLRLALDYQRSKHLLPPITRPVSLTPTVPATASPATPPSLPPSLQEHGEDRPRDRRTHPVAFARLH